MCHRLAVSRARLAALRGELLREVLERDAERLRHPRRSAVAALSDQHGDLGEALMLGQHPLQDVGVDPADGATDAVEISDALARVLDRIDDRELVRHEGVDAIALAPLRSGAG